MQTRVMIPTGCHTPRRTAWAPLAGLAAVLALGAGCKHDRDPGTGSASSGSGAAAKPSGPVTINVVDVAGTLQLVQDALERAAPSTPTRSRSSRPSRRRRPSCPAS
jgi:hypothetical protein